MPGIAPHQREDREYESNLGLYRLDRHMTVKELCEAVGTDPTTYCALNNGMASPLYERGPKRNEPKPVVRSLLRFFDVELEDLFPRYACKMPDQRWLTKDQLTGITHGRAGDPFQEIEDREYIGWLIRYELFYSRGQGSLESRKRRIMALRLYYWEGMSLREVGKVLGVQPERIRQMNARTLRGLRSATVQERNTQ
jgi:transcriptional regulator with XRE-family HTH domain